MRRGAPRVLVLLALVLSACGGAPAPGPTLQVVTPPPHPAWPSDPTRLFASDSYLMARIDVRAARHTTHWDLIAELLIRSVGNDGPGALLRALATKADLILVGIAPAIPAGGDERVVALLEGADLDADIAAAVSEGGPPVAPTMVRGVEVTAAHGVAAVKLDARHWILVTDTDLGTVLDAATGLGPGPSDLHLRAIAERAGFTQGTAVVATRVTPDVQGMARQAPIDAARGIGDAQYLAGRVDLAGGARLMGTADMASPEAAAQLADALSRELDAQSHGILASMLGLAPILARATVRATATRVDGQLSVTDDEVGSLLGRLGGMMRMAGGSAPPL